MAVTFAKLGQYGRMGNAMFQAAATMAVAWRHNAGFQFPNWEYQDDFNISRYHFVLPIQPRYTYEEPHFHYAPIPYEKDMNLHGYFQSEKYFEDYKDRIRERFASRYKYRLREDTCSIHVRRGDYLVHKGCYNILDMNYYGKAMSKSGCKKFLVFSDDIKWCKTQFIGREFEFSPEKNPVKDLARMSKCATNIIANSSFSWWGSWLNQNPNKIVIAPANWFGPVLFPTHNTKDLLPKKWIKV